MPATIEDYRLAQAHRRDQADIQRGYANEAAALWALWAQGRSDPEIRQVWLTQNVRLIKDWRSRSEARGLRFVRDAYRLDKRREIGPRTPVQHKTDKALVRDLLDRSAGVYKKARLVGLDEAVAEERARNATFGSGGRNVQAGGRDAIQQTKQAMGWMRVSDGDPCSFCALLISRGAEYRTAETAGESFKFHDRCGCTVLPIFSRTDFMSADAQRFRDLYNKSIEDEDGNVIHTGADARNAFRRALDAQRRAAAA